MANQGEFREVMKLVLEGKLNPIVDKVFPLENVREAVKYLSDGTQFGKVLIKGCFSYSFMTAIMLRPPASELGYIKIVG